MINNNLNMASNKTLPAGDTQNVNGTISSCTDQWIRESVRADSRRRIGLRQYWKSGWRDILIDETTIHSTRHATHTARRFWAIITIDYCRADVISGQAPEMRAHQFGKTDVYQWPLENQRPCVVVTGNVGWICGLGRQNSKRLLMWTLGHCLIVFRICARSVEDEHCVFP